MGGMWIVLAGGGVSAVIVTPTRQDVCVRPAPVLTRAESLSVRPPPVLTLNDGSGFLEAAE
jgi:hypothetical protein